MVWHSILKANLCGCVHHSVSQKKKKKNAHEKFAANEYKKRVAVNTKDNNKHVEFWIHLSIIHVHIKVNERESTYSRAERALAHRIGTGHAYYAIFVLVFFSHCVCVCSSHILVPFLHLVLLGISLAVHTCVLLDACAFPILTICVRVWVPSKCTCLLLFTSGEQNNDKKHTSKFTRI